MIVVKKFSGMNTFKAPIQYPKFESFCLSVFLLSLSGSIKKSLADGNPHQINQNQTRTWILDVSAETWITFSANILQILRA